MDAIPIRDDAHWHELRAKHIGGSEVAAMFGMSSYTSVWQLWMEKAGKLPPEDISDRKHIQAGTFLESGIAAWAAHRWSMSISKVTDYYTVDDCPGMGASFDFATEDLCPVEIKWSSGWRAGWEYERDVITEAPDVYVLQVQHQMACTGAPHGWLIALLDGEPRRMKIPRNDNIIASIKEEIAKFWASVESGDAPEPDYSRDAEAIGRLMGVAPRSDVDLSNVEDAQTLFERLKEANETVKVAEAVAKEAKAELLMMAREKMATMNTSQEKAVVKCGAHKMTISTVKENLGTEVTPDMVGTRINARKGYLTVRVS